MLQTSLLLMKSLNKTETPIFLSVVWSLFPKAIFLTFISSKKSEFRNETIQLKVNHLTDGYSDVISESKLLLVTRQLTFIHQDL